MRATIHDEMWRKLKTFLDPIITSRLKRTASRTIPRLDGVSRNPTQTARRRAYTWNCLEKSARVRVSGPPKEIVDGRLFNDAPPVHHSDPVNQAPHDT
jgi:hypothetical protein